MIAFGQVVLRSRIVLSTNILAWHEHEQNQIMWKFRSELLKTFAEVYEDSRATKTNYSMFDVIIECPPQPL